MIWLWQKYCTIKKKRKVGEQFQRLHHVEDVLWGQKKNHEDRNVQIQAEINRKFSRGTLRCDPWRFPDDVMHRPCMWRRFLLLTVKREDAEKVYDPLQNWSDYYNFKNWISGLVRLKISYSFSLIFIISIIIIKLWLVLIESTSFR